MRRHKPHFLILQSLSNYNNVVHIIFIISNDNTDRDRIAKDREPKMELLKTPYTLAEINETNFENRKMKSFSM